jgi:arginine deiminase
MSCLHISSEIGALQSVLVHTPGTELQAVTPGTREDYLYDDIIDLETAQREHRQFVAVLSRFAQVRQVRKLLAEVLENPEARNFLITKTMDVIPSDALAQKLGALPAAEIVRMIVEGTEEPSGPIARALN